MKKFYAAHSCACNEVAIFNSEEERDEWVNHQDWFSKEFQEDGERIALTQNEAESLVGNLLYKKEEHEHDIMLENVMWVVAPFGMEAVI